MKKLLLFAIALCFYAAQPKNVFGKCEPHLEYTYSHMINGSWGGGIYGGEHFYLSQGDSLRVNYQTGTAYCDLCYLTNFHWYKDGNLILQNVSSITIHETGVYLAETCFSNISLSWTFTISFFPTGINTLASSTLPFPFSPTSNINTNHLCYTIINATGKVIEHGIFSGKIILRDAKPQNPLPQGIYFVIYYDALDNRQVLTDKVFVTNQ